MSAGGATPERAPAAGGAVGEMLTRRQPCITCGYELLGLPIAGNCPECGRAVADSLRGILLCYADGAYLRTVLSGLGLVLNAIVVMVVGAIVFFACVLGSILIGTPGAGSGWIMTVLAVAGTLGYFGLTVMSLAGYWRFSEPDPQFLVDEQPHGARRVLRAAVVVSACAALASVLMQGLMVAGTLPRVGGGGWMWPLSGRSGAASLAGGGMSGVALAVVVMSGLVQLVGGLAWVTQFFAAMLYTRWLASRIPDAKMVRTASRYLWLLPLIAVVGYACIGLGPLVAMILYWNLLDGVRRHMRGLVS